MLPTLKDLWVGDLHLVGNGVGAHIVIWNLPHFAMHQSLEVLAGDGTLLGEREMPGKTIGGHTQPVENSLTPQPWPAGAVGWVMTSGYYHPNGACNATTRVEALRGDGATPLVRDLHEGEAAGWVVLDNGSVLIGGVNWCDDDASGWLLLLPKCH